MQGLASMQSWGSSVSSSASAPLQAFYDKGWIAEQVLGIGAGGPVRLVRLPGPRGRADLKSVLKRSTATEVRALEALAHCSNIVQLEEHFLGSRDSEVWVRLEWLQGGSLREALRASGGTLTEDGARRVVAEVLSALKAIHRAGWMHRDVKAENIGVSEVPIGKRSAVKLLDFDTAIEVPPHGQSLHDVVGTVENMAPEVYEGAYNELADCWSLGIVAHEVLFGYRPFNDCSIERIEEMIRNWKQYLLLPSGSHATISFLGQLLRSREDRMSSEAAARHPWVLLGSRASAATLPNSSGCEESISTSPTPLRNSKSRGGDVSPCSTAGAQVTSSASREAAVRRDSFELRLPTAALASQSSSSLGGFGLTSSSPVASTPHKSPVGRGGPSPADEFEQHSTYLQQARARAAELQAAAMALASEAKTSQESSMSRRHSSTPKSAALAAEGGRRESCASTMTADSFDRRDSETMPSTEASSVEDVLVYLQGVREQTSDILRRLSVATQQANQEQASVPAPAAATPTAASRPAELPRQSVQSSPTNSKSKDYQRSPTSAAAAGNQEGSSTSSPRTHLAMQRRRTASLLRSLQDAAQHIETKAQAVSAGPG
mmetsp:Transcript_31892/g.74605  ORF Transcript_31892/g.74605 Transcript_31892/m.74605 type:complete len:604 (+) Transcript_31892:94-1905(+)